MELTKQRLIRIGLVMLMGESDRECEEETSACQLVESDRE